MILFGHDTVHLMVIIIVQFPSILLAITGQSGTRRGYAAQDIVAESYRELGSNDINKVTSQE